MKDELAALILEFFDGDEVKTNLWFATRNPLLGEISPTQMIQAGRYDRLLQWAKGQIAENSAPDDPAKGDRPTTTNCGYCEGKCAGEGTSKETACNCPCHFEPCPTCKGSPLEGQIRLSGGRKEPKE